MLLSGRYLLALVPLVALLVGFEALILGAIPTSNASKWELVDGAESGFQTPRR